MTWPGLGLYNVLLEIKNHLSDHRLYCELLAGEQQTSVSIYPDCKHKHATILLYYFSLCYLFSLCKFQGCNQLFNIWGYQKWKPCFDRTLFWILVFIALLLYSLLYCHLLTPPTTPSFSLFFFIILLTYFAVIILMFLSGLALGVAEQQVCPVCFIFFFFLHLSHLAVFHYYWYPPLYFRQAEGLCREETREAVKVSSGNLVRPWSRVIWQARYGIHFTKKERMRGKSEREEIGGDWEGHWWSKKEMMNLNSNNCMVTTAWCLF